MTHDRQLARQTAQCYLQRGYIQTCLPACVPGDWVAGWLGGWVAGWLVGRSVGRSVGLRACVPACLRACVPLAQIEGGGRAERQACRSRQRPQTIFYFLTNTHVVTLQTTARTSARTLPAHAIGQIVLLANGKQSCYNRVCSSHSLLHPASSRRPNSV
jgi:hypothetical protein